MTREMSLILMVLRRFGRLEILIESGANEEDVARLQADFDAKREAYGQKGKKVKLRNLAADGNVLSADVGYVSFPVYNEFANQGNTPELLDLSAATGTGGKKYKVDATSIATDVESGYIGKALVADRFLQFLRDKGIKPEKFVAFGDSISDLEMADELLRRNQQAEFVYVGPEEKLEEARAKGKIKDDEVIRNVGGFTKGTLEYLRGEK